MILEIVIVAATLVGILYWLIAGRRRRSRAADVDVPLERVVEPPSPEKDAALERFRAIHAKARDNLAKVQEGIETDPRRATNAFRQLMKRE